MESHRSQRTATSTFDVNSSLHRSRIWANVWVSEYLFQCYNTPSPPSRDEAQIAFLGRATANSKSGGKVIVIEFGFSAVGFSFRAIALADDLCRIPLTRSSCRWSLLFSELAIS